MWTRLFFTVFIFLASCTAGERKCTLERKAALHQGVEAGFDQWKHTLDYMDHEVIDSDLTEMKQCIEEARPCLAVDSLPLQLLDSIHEIYTHDEPSTLEILRAEQMTQRFEAALKKLGE